MGEQETLIQDPFSPKSRFKPVSLVSEQSAVISSPWAKHYPALLLKLAYREQEEEKKPEEMQLIEWDAALSGEETLSVLFLHFGYWIQDVVGQC